MSTSLIVLLPIILLGIVGTLCFVGCIFPPYELAPPYTAYTNKTVLLNKDIIAYWPLKETSDTVPASELISNNTGMYIDPSTAKPDTVYPWPEYSVANGDKPDVLSAAAPGDIQFAQPTIVVGDVDLRPDDPVKPACMVVNGCYVEVPWDEKFVPQTSFTVEAWVRVDWTADDPHAWRFVLDMREREPATTGFAIYAKADEDQPGIYRWAAVLGNGSSTFTLLDSTELSIALKDSAAATGKIFYLALTYDAASQLLSLFVNGDQRGQTTSAYMQNAAQVLWIGAGTPYSPRRTQPPASPDPESPLFPFVGAIQDVAIYMAALEPAMILTHFHNGNGIADPEE